MKFHFCLFYEVSEIYCVSYLGNRFEMSRSASSGVGGEYFSDIGGEYFSMVTGGEYFSSGGSGWGGIVGATSSVGWKSGTNLALQVEWNQIDVISLSEAQLKEFLNAKSSTNHLLFIASITKRHPEN